MKDFFKQSIAVMLGGGCGTLSRFYTIHAFDKFSLPTSIIILNISGCFVCGLLLGLLEKRAGDVSKSFIFIGFLGAYTTLSDISLFFNNYILMKEVWRAIIYVSISVRAGLALFSLGYFFSKKRFPDR